MKSAGTSLKISFSPIGHRISTSAILGSAARPNCNRAALPKVVDGRAVHRNDVELAIVIAIDQADSSAHRLNNVLYVRRGHMPDRQADVMRNFFEVWQLCPEVCRRNDDQKNDG